MLPVEKTDVVQVYCEWEDCENTYNDVTDLMFHINEIHMIPLTQTGQSVLPEYECRWRECDHDPFSDFSEISRHIYFHAFHSKLKGLGRIVIEKNKLGSCQLDTSSRNLIPDLHKPFKCQWQDCNEDHDNPQLYYDHVRDHCNYYYGRHQQCKCLWNGCSEVRKCKFKLKEHMKRHSQEKGLACPQCGSLFSFSSKLYDHIQRQKDPEASTYQCSHCSKRFATERILRDHMRHHVNHVMCPICKMTMPTPSTLSNHMLYRHSDIRPFQCDRCSYSAKTAKDLKSHLERHEQSQMKCGMCEYRTLNSSELTQHYQRKHNPEGKLSPYQCHLCEKCYHRGGKLTAHLKQVHDYKWPMGLKKFKYKLCEDNRYRLQTVRYESVALTKKKQEEAPAQEQQPPAEAQTSQSTEGDENYSYNLDLLGDVAMQAKNQEFTLPAQPSSSSQEAPLPPQFTYAPSNMPVLEFTTDMNVDLSQPILAAIVPHQSFAQRRIEDESPPDYTHGIPEDEVGDRGDLGSFNQAQDELNIDQGQSIGTQEQPGTKRPRRARKPAANKAPPAVKKPPRKKPANSRPKKKAQTNKTQMTIEKPTTDFALSNISETQATQEDLNYSFDIDEHAAAMEKALTGVSPVKKKSRRKSAPRKVVSRKRGKSVDEDESAAKRRRWEEDQEDLTTYKILTEGQQIVVESNVPFAGVANELSLNSVIGTITEIPPHSSGKILSSTPKKNSPEYTISHSKALSQPLLHIMSPNKTGE